MPRIRLNDFAGIDVDGKLAMGIGEALRRFRDIGTLPLDQVPLSELSSGIDFSHTADIVSLGAAAGVSLAILRRGDHVIDEDDPFGEIGIADDEVWLKIGVTISGSVGAGSAAGGFSFGFARDQVFEVRGYRRFRKTGPGFPAFLPALGQALAGFVYPRTLEDLEAMDGDFIAVLSGTGKLTVHGGFSVETPVSTVAAVAIANQELGVRAGASAGVEAAVIVTGGYQVRVRRHQGAVELSLYTIDSAERSLSFKAKAGFKAGVGEFDAARLILGQLNGGSVADFAEFERAVPGDDDEDKQRRIEAIDTKLRGMIESRIEASLSASFSKIESDEAVWQFSVDPASEPAAPAIKGALEGDFEALTADPAALPEGVTQTANILTHADVRKTVLEFHLLGFVNWSSSAKLLASTELTRDAQGNVTVITDTASSTRLMALIAGFGNDRKRLRRMLNESFLFQAVYSGAGLADSSFRARHTYFEIHDRTSRGEMKNNLDVPRALGLASREGVAKILGAGKNFGRTTMYVETSYSHEAVLSIFLEAGKARTHADFVKVGRSALGALLAGDDPNDPRHLLTGVGTLASDTLWDRIQKEGPPIIPKAVKLVAGQEVVVAGSYNLINDWAQEMHEAAVALAAVRQPGAGDGAKREMLKNALASAAGKSRSHWDDPWGQLAVCLAAHFNGTGLVRITGEDLGAHEWRADNLTNPKSQGAANLS